MKLSKLAALILNIYPVTSCACFCTVILLGISFIYLGFWYEKLAGVGMILIGFFSLAGFLGLQKANRRMKS